MWRMSQVHKFKEPLFPEIENKENKRRIVYVTKRLKVET